MSCDDTAPIIFRSKIELSIHSRTTQHTVGIVHFFALVLFSRTKRKQMKSYINRHSCYSNDECKQFKITGYRRVQLYQKILWHKIKARSKIWFRAQNIRVLFHLFVCFWFYICLNKRTFPLMHVGYRRVNRNRNKNTLEKLIVMFQQHQRKKIWFCTKFFLKREQMWWDSARGGQQMNS